MQGMEFDLDKIFLLFNLDDLKSDVEPSLQFISGPKIFYPGFINQQLDSSKNIKLLSKISYKLNNVGHRGEDFSKINKDNVNILFAGCSITFGEYLPENFSWPHHVYKYFKDSKTNVGPLNIISYPGASGPKLVYNIFKYFNNYGIPDYLFILMPDMFRYYGPQKDGKSFLPLVPFTDGDKILESMNPLQGIYEFQQFYRMLEIVCNLLKIKLYSTSWSNFTNETIKSLQFKTYKSLNYNDFEEIINNLDQDFLKLYDKDFYITAADGMHPGLFTQIKYAQHFINRNKNDI